MAKSSVSILVKAFKGEIGLPTIIPRQLQMFKYQAVQPITYKNCSVFVHSLTIVIMHRTWSLANLTLTYWYARFLQAVKRPALAQRRGSVNGF